MLDVRRLRQEPEEVKAALAKRQIELPAVVDRVLARDAERRDALAKVNDLKARRNEASKRVGELRRTGGDASELIAATKSLGDEIAALDDVVRVADADIEAALLRVPNAPLDEVEAGGEDANKIVSVAGKARLFGFTARPHWEIGEKLGILDLVAGARLSGSGFPLLRGMGARLQRGLIDWFLDVHTREHGYVELRVPYLVTAETMTGTGQLPKFAEDLYQAERDHLWLIPTAEVPVTNLHRDELLAFEDLPLCYTAYTPCFRREAGAAGKDTRGLLRVHQFDKVELVRYEAPERSREALEELAGEAETLLDRLGLHWRRVQLAAGDMGFNSAMTYDLEVWAPGVAKWLEVSSCSSCTDYQARRANLRFRRSRGAKPEFVHTLNGSALALPRVLAALLETYQEEDGSVTIPELLVPYVGTSRLTPPA
jgi:seryl-tRNA synthetase